MQLGAEFELPIGFARAVDGVDDRRQTGRIDERDAGQIEKYAVPGGELALERLVQRVGARKVKLSIDHHVNATGVGGPDRKLQRLGQAAVAVDGGLNVWRVAQLTTKFSPVRGVEIQIRGRSVAKQRRRADRMRDEFACANA